MASSYNLDGEDGDDEIKGINIQEDAATEEDVEIIKIEERVRAHAAPSAHRLSMSDPDRVAEEDIEAELEAEIMCIDLTADEEQQPVAEAAESETRPKRLSRNLPLDPALFTILNSFVNKASIELIEDKVIELNELLGYHRIQFVKITTVFRHRITGDTMFRGFGYARSKNLRGQLPRKVNEVCRILEIDQDDDRNVQAQALVEVDADAAVSERFLHTTNRSFPQVRLTDEWKSMVAQENLQHVAPLVCRWNHLIWYKDATKRKAHKGVEFALEHVREEESQAKHAIKDGWKRDMWRQVPMAIDRDHEHEHEHNNRTATGPQRHSYTAADLFSGAGGASRGIERAGFDMKLAVDHWPPACRTYRANFRDVKVVESDVYDFINEATTHSDAAAAPIVDVIHLSPPCQVWSPAHTIPGCNDAANEAVLFACSSLIRMLRPRIFTLEQTFGILHDRFALHFNVLVQGFTEQGYSVRWRVIHLETLGLPQPRKRLIMLGACPGEKLPSFPAATHGAATPGLKPLVTVAQTLARIKPGANITLHNLDSMKELEKPPYDANRVLPRCITCSGGQNYHPSGKRNFTLREYALLQGFPTWHRFESPNIKKQIGNAFPPCVVRVLYQHIRKHLLVEDGYQVDGQVVVELSPSPFAAQVVVDIDGGEGDDVVSCEPFSSRPSGDGRDKPRANDNGNREDDNVVLIDMKSLAVREKGRGHKKGQQGLASGAGARSLSKKPLSSKDGASCDIKSPAERNCSSGEQLLRGRRLANEVKPATVEDKQRKPPKRKEPPEQTSPARQAIRVRVEGLPVRASISAPIRVAAIPTSRDMPMQSIEIDDDSEESKPHRATPLPVEQHNIHVAQARATSNVDPIGSCRSDTSSSNTVCGDDSDLGYDKFGL